MSDRELLELAARAAGLDGEYARMHQTYGDEWIDGINAGSPILWNPLADDGDALRLAVLLRIDINMNRDSVGTLSVNRMGSKPRFCQAAEIFHDDANAATRRAIVRAAAALAQMKEA